MSILKQLLLLLSVVPMALSYPFFPPTCYSKALSMAQELTQMANACVMYKMRDYISLVEDLRRRRCGYTREVRKLEVTLRQLFIVMGEKCHGAFWDNILLAKNNSTFLNICLPTIPVAAA
uniref:Uncharacterized protein n=1 Tax=Poecilia mexicana TaxID=48701 RepID=A0A3B3WGG7_9TELE